MIGLFASWIFIYLVCKIVRIPYDNVVAGAYDAIRMVVPTLCLLMAIYSGHKIISGKSRKKKDPVSEEAHTVNHEYHDTASLL